MRIFGQNPAGRPKRTGYQVLGEALDGPYLATYYPEKWGERGAVRPRAAAVLRRHRRRRRSIPERRRRRRTTAARGCNAPRLPAQPAMPLSPSAPRIAPVASAGRRVDRGVRQIFP